MKVAKKFPKVLDVYLQFLNDHYRDNYETLKLIKLTFELLKTNWENFHEMEKNKPTEEKKERKKRKNDPLKNLENVMQQIVNTIEDVNDNEQLKKIKDDIKEIIPQTIKDIINENI